MRSATGECHEHPSHRLSRPSPEEGHLPPSLSLYEEETERGDSYSKGTGYRGGGSVTMARRSDRALAVPAEPASGLDPPGFDPSRIRAIAAIVVRRQWGWAGQSRAHR